MLAKNTVCGGKCNLICNVLIGVSIYIISLWEANLPPFSFVICERLCWLFKLGAASSRQKVSLLLVNHSPTEASESLFSQSEQSFVLPQLELLVVSVLTSLSPYKDHIWMLYYCYKYLWLNIKDVTVNTIKIKLFCIYSLSR